MTPTTLTTAELQAATPPHLDHAKWDNLLPYLEAKGLRIRTGDRWHWRITGDGAEISLVD